MTIPARGNDTTERYAAILGDLWREVLGRQDIGPDDNFFDCGGDSLLAVRLSARARERDLHLKSTDVYVCQTIAKLATRVAPLVRTGAASSTEHNEQAGTVALLPSQRRWLDGEIPDIDYFNLDVLLTCPPLAEAQLADVARCLLLRHEALRLRYRNAGGDWTAEEVAADDQLVAGAVEQVTLADDLAADGTADPLARVLERYHRSLSLAEGRVFRLVHIDIGGGQARLFVLVHHLTADGVSMSILLDDLESAVTAVLRGATPALPTASAMPSDYARALHDWSRMQQATQAVGTWLALPWDEIGPVPRDHELGPGRLSTWRTVTGALSEQDTSRLAPMASRGTLSPQNAAIAALLGAIATWSGAMTHLFDIYAHSRDGGALGVDLSRTIGYVQSTYPAVLSWTPERGPLPNLLAVERQMAALPSDRHSFDTVRFCAASDADSVRLRALPRAQLRCNFRGQLGRVIERSGFLLREASEQTVGNRSPSQTERYRLLTEGDLVEGRLVLGIRYSTDFYQRDTVQRLVDDALRILSDAAAELR